MINGFPGKGMEHEIKIFFYSNDVLNCKFMLKALEKKTHSYVNCWVLGVNKGILP
jgi:hypothetical protein